MKMLTRVLVITMMFGIFLAVIPPFSEYAQGTKIIKHLKKKALGKNIIKHTKKKARGNKIKNRLPSRSTTIALTSDDRRLVVVNRQKNSVSIIEVRRNGKDVERLIAEIPVGRDPRFVAISPNNKKAYVTNGRDGTVSVIKLNSRRPALYGKPIKVGEEPRGIALTPNGKYAVVANHTSGTVSIIQTRRLRVIATVPTGGNPMAIAITNNGNKFDLDERVYVTRFFSELIDPARPDGFDDAKQGVIDTFRLKKVIRAGLFRGKRGKSSKFRGSFLKKVIKQVTLPPIASGFTADRRQFCLNTRNILQENGGVVFFNSGPDGQGNGAASLASEVFCPDPTSQDASPDGPIGSSPQGVYPNLLHAALIRKHRLYVLNIGAAPAPPVRFNNNVQALLSVVNKKRGKWGKHDFTLNLNLQVAQETQPTQQAGSLDRLFLNDVVAMDADRKGKKLFILSRGGNYLLQAKVKKSGQIDIGAPEKVVRFQTGNMPSGVVINSKGTRAYTNNEINTSVTSINLKTKEVLNRDIASSQPPRAGSLEHRRLVGKLLFFTALGIPDVHDISGDRRFDLEIRDIEPLQFRGKASRDGWSSCASCHEDGHVDGVTWMFPTGPRQAIDLAGSFAKNDFTDQRIMNWNAVRGSPATDFNNNSRGVQGGTGHATDVNGQDRTGEIFNHGPVVGISDALDAMHEWIASIRSLNQPDQKNQGRGRTVFATHCASCHGGAKWTKSRTSPLFLNNPTFNENPIGANFFIGVPPRDANLTVAGPQIFSVTDGNRVLRFLENVGTFDPTKVLEIRGAGAIAGQSTQGFPALSAQGAFNVPSLLNIKYGAPYLHDGSAKNFEDVFAVHALGNSTILGTLGAQERKDLINLLNSIDDETKLFESDTDRFLNGAP